MDFVDTMAKLETGADDIEWVELEPVASVPVEDDPLQDVPAEPARMLTQSGRVNF